MSLRSPVLVLSAVLGSMAAWCGGCTGAGTGPDPASRPPAARLANAVAPAPADAAVTPTVARPPCPCADSQCSHHRVSFCGQEYTSRTTRITCYEGRTSTRQPAMDLRPLACATQLRELVLVSGELEFILTLSLVDLQPLAGLTQLTTLHLGHTTVDDIEALRDLRALRDLSLHASPVHDLRPLSELVELRTLDLSGTRVTDLQPLRDLRHLERLDISATPVRDVTALAGLPELEWLGVLNNHKISSGQLRSLRLRRPDLRISEGRRY